MFLTAFENTLLLSNDIWLTQANPNNRYIIIMHRESMASVSCLLTCYLQICICFVLLWGIKKQKETGIIGHYWKLFPLSLGNIDHCLRSRTIFPYFVETISSSDLNTSLYLYNIVRQHDRQSDQRRTWVESIHGLSWVHDFKISDGLYYCHWCQITTARKQSGSRHACPIGMQDGMKTHKSPNTA